MKIKVKSLIKKFFSKEKRGFALILVAIFIPVALIGIQYGIKLAQKSDKDVSTFETPYAVVQKIANNFNPGRSWDEQYECLYSLGAQEYNNRYYNVSKSMVFTPKLNHLLTKQTSSYSAKNYVEFYNTHSRLGSLYYGSYEKLNFLFTSSLFFDAMTYCTPTYQNVSGENIQKTDNISPNTKEKTYTIYSERYQDNIAEETSSGNYIPEYNEKATEMQVKINSTNNQIIGTFPRLKRKATATLPKCNVDIILAIPTNHAACTEDNSNDSEIADTSDSNSIEETPIRQIASACQDFLRNNFLHTVGVAVGVIPYSGKISLPPDRSAWTTRYKMSPIDPEETLVKYPYIIQTMFYGSDGQFGGELIDDSNGKSNDNYGIYKDWGTSDIGLPIMSRRGKETTYRGIRIYNMDKIINFDEPATDESKFIQMNPNPCYLGYCNALAMLCERNCPTYWANPYYITELTADIQSVIHDLELFIPFDDPHNKSNFLFLPVVWAGNLLSSWTKHPSDADQTASVMEPKRNEKNQVIIIIANAPDNFEPVELTYLGFNNDASEVPMFESDTAQFSNGGYVYKDGGYQGVKGAIKCSINSAHITENIGLISEGKQTMKISFPHKSIVKIVASRGDPATVTFFEDNGVEDNVMTDPATGEDYSLIETFEKEDTNNKGNNVILSESTSKKSRTHRVIGTTNFFFNGDTNIRNMINNKVALQDSSTTGGKNFGHNLSVKKLKYRAKRCALNRSTLSNQVLRFYGYYNRNELNKDLIENTDCHSDNQNITRMDPGIDCSDNARSDSGGNNGSSKKWGYSTSSTGYYINSYNFQPKFKGVRNPNRIVYATDNFPNNNVLYSEGDDYLMTIKKNNTWERKDSVQSEINSNKVLYRVTEFGSYDTGTDYSQIFFGRYQYYSKLAYYDDFISKKTRTRNIYQTIKTTRNYVNQCKQPNSVQLTTTSGNNTNTSYTCDYENTNAGVCCFDHGQFSGKASPYTFNENDNNSFACNTINWNDKYPDSHNNWEYYDTSYAPYQDRKLQYQCNSIGKRTEDKQTCDHPNCQPKVEFKTQFKQVQKQSVDCTYDSCHEFSNPTTTFIPYSEYECTNCNYNGNKTSCNACNGKDTQYSGAKTDDAVKSDDKIQIEKWVESEEIKRQYVFESVDSTGKVLSTAYKICNIDGNNCQNSTKPNTELKNKISDFSSGKYELSPYRYNLYNFFLLNANTVEQTNFYTYDQCTNKCTKVSTAPFISSKNNNKLKNNQGICLLAESGAERDPNLNIDETNWICFCGDADLNLEFIARDSPTLNLLHIKNDVYRVSFDNQAVTNTTGTEIHTFSDDADTQTFYIIPEQIMDEKDKDDNYYIKLEMGDNVSIVSIEINNRPYKIEKSGDIMFNGKSMKNITEKISSKETLEFVTNLKESFKCDVVVPYFWIGKTDFRQEEGNTYIYCNTTGFSTEVTVKVPSAGKQDFYKKSSTQCDISSSRKLKSVTFNGYTIPRASINNIVMSGNNKKFNANNPIVTTWNEKEIDPKYILSNSKHFSFSGSSTDSGFNVNAGCEFQSLNFSNISQNGGSKQAGTSNGNSSVEISFKETYKFYNGERDINVSGNSPIEIYGKGTKPGGDNCTNAVLYYGDSGGQFMTGNKEKSESGTAYCTKLNNARVLFNGCGRIDGSEYKQTSASPDVDQINAKTNGNKASFPGTATVKCSIKGIQHEDHETKSLSNPVGSFSDSSLGYRYNNITVSNIYIHENNPGSCVELYSNGQFGSSNIGLGGKTITTISNFSIKSGTNYRSPSYKVRNAILSLENSGGQIGHKYINSSNNNYITVEISPDEYDFELQSDGKYHVKLDCRNVQLSNFRFSNTDENVKVYDHPDIKKSNEKGEAIQNIRLFDGGGINGANNKDTSKIYGDMEVNLGNYKWSPVQKLFYYVKQNGSEDEFSPNNTIGDFFVNIWDQNDDIPPIKWKLKGKIQNNIYNDPDFGEFKNNYGFSGLHRMFIPYGVYDSGEDITAGFSEANNSALVFAGFTIPANFMLINNGYQQISSSDGIATKVTEPNTVLPKVASDACSKLKSFATGNSAPDIYLIKYRTSGPLSLESCVGGGKVLSASSEDDLKKVLSDLAVTIKQANLKNDLIIEMEDVK